MTTTANAENLRQNKSTFSLIVEQILAFGARTNPANILWSSRRLEDVFKTCFED